MKTKKITPILSKHCLGTIITQSPEILTDMPACLKRVRAILDKHHVQYLGDIAHEFPNHSYTILISLAESHISIHTWPERHAVQLDVFLCNYLRDNNELCQTIFDDLVRYFKPTEKMITYAERL